ncbi:protein maph-9-like [Frieseomelitta varia]|uniref:protein maph-9-like n=1 Tax=Frieseomelitta varia TaxID=561572 RepID=UPI001CB6A87B|nr:protein maph-9-like [Frieseomelitta varia]
MTRPYQRNCANVFVLSILLQLFVPRCCPEFVKNTPSNAVANGHVIENRNGKLDPSIERIFRGSSEQRDDVTNFKRNVRSEKHEDGDKRVRMKRDSAVKRRSSNPRSSNQREEATRNEKRSVSDRDEGKSHSSRIGRSSKDLPKLPDKDYGVSVDREKSEYTDEAEDDSSSRNKKTRYKGNDLRASEDSAAFIDEEERSNLYDDLESKDVVKRGISGAEDYEEVEDDAAGAAEDTAALEGNSLSQEEETQRRKVHGDVRVKREHENSKGESEEKSEDPGASGDSSSDRKRSDNGNKAAEASGKDSNDQSKKRDAVEKSENCSRQQFDSKPIGETVKIQGPRSEIVTDVRTQETDLSGKALNDLMLDPSTILEGIPRKSKVVEAENSRNADEDYQKRVEEQIQRKIDSIKEQIKREIEESQRLREIEENNARFDELRELEKEDDEHEASLVGQDASKSADKSQARDNAAKRSTKRSKRHDNTVRESEISTSMRKRSTTKSESRAADEVPRKRARQAFLVTTDRKKKRRRRRSRNSEGRKLEDSLPADLSLDSKLSEALGADKSGEDEKAVLGPLATEYGEAFGGLNGDPGMELARFKRIKRVLRSPTSRT